MKVWLLFILVGDYSSGGGCDIIGVYEKIFMRIYEMKIDIRRYSEKDLPYMTAIWNEVVDEGIAFPQEEL